MVTDSSEVRDAAPAASSFRSICVGQGVEMENIILGPLRHDYFKLYEDRVFVTC